MAHALRALCLAVSCWGVLGSPGGRAPDVHERLLFHGVRSTRHANVQVGAGAVAHSEADPPPRYLGEESCASECVWDIPMPVKRSGDDVHVKWTMKIHSTATNADWVGLYEEDAPNADYIEWFKASVDPTGMGQRTLKLYNLRTKLQFRYIQSHRCLCASPAVGFELGTIEPTQPHLSLTGDPTEMQLTWVSGHATGFVEMSGTDARILSEASTYAASDMCGPPATTVGPWGYRDVGWIHTATLKGLKQDTSYQYRFGNANATSEWITFRTEPSGSQEWTAIAYGDMGVAGRAESIYDQMPGAHLVQVDSLSRKPRLVVHFGDLSYARSVGFVWDIWGNQISPLASTVPYMVSLGNHEYDHTGGADKDPSGAGVGFHPTWGNYGDDSSGECGVPVVKRFPHPPPTGFGIFWYSYDYANVHWVMLSSEHDYTINSTQYVWLAKDLAKVDRKKTPWVIVTAHRPAYNSEEYESDHTVANNMAQNLDDLLVRSQVNLFLAGHYHAYERTCPAAHQTCQGNPSSPSAPIHITVGSAGADLDNVGSYPADTKWAMKLSDVFGHLLLRVRPEKIVGEFWGGEGRNNPSLPFSKLDSFEVHPFAQNTVYV